MSTQKLRRIFTRLLVSVLLISSVPLKALATEIIPAEDANADLIPVKKTTTNRQALSTMESKSEIGELIDKRTENTKTFYNGNGQYTEKIYSEPVHIKEEGEEKYVEISPELTEAQSQTNIVKTENTAIDTEFLKNMSNGKYAEFSYEGHSMSLSILQATGENKTPLEANDVDAEFVENTNKIVHKDIFPHIDLQNHTFNENIKEDIVLNQYDGYHIFTFKLLTDLTASIDEDGNIQMKDEQGKKVFELPKPYMSDSKIDEETGDTVISDKVKFELKKIEDGYKLTINADKDWLASPGRVFPIYIDPTTSVTNSSDAFVSSNNSTVNYSTATSKWDSSLEDYVLKAGQFDSATGTAFAFLTQPSPTGLSNVTINGAEFHAYVADASSTANLYLDRLTTSWSSSTVTWNNKPNSTKIANLSVGKGKWINFDVTDVVKSWQAGTYSNYGFKFHMNGQAAWKKIISTNSSSKNAYISVDYTIPVNSSVPSPELLSAKAYSYGTGDGTGYVDINWKSVTGADSYIVWIYNGTAYEGFPVEKGTTSFSTKGKKIWPKQSAIDNGRRLLYHTDIDQDKDDRQELPINPSYLYKASGGAYPTVNYFWFRVSAVKDGVGTSPTNGQLNPTIPNLKNPANFTIRSYTNMVGTKTGYVTLDWEKVTGAKGYKIWIFNGKHYESYDVGDVDHWTTQNKGIWPKDSEINGSMTYLHHPADETSTSYGGAELPVDPTNLYGNNGTTHNKNPNYFFKISAYDTGGQETVYTPYLKTPIGENVPFLGMEEYWSFVDVPGGSINTATGNFIATENDFSLGGKGPGISIDRTYNSQSSLKGLFGYNWHSNLDSSINLVGNEANYIDEDGTLLTFVKDTNGVYRPPTGTGIYLELTENDDKLKLKDTDQSIKTFDKTTGKLLSIEDGYHVKTTFNYTDNQLTSITDSSTPNRKVDITYNEEGYISQLKLLSDERLIKYTYTNDLLSKVTNANEEVTEYRYDDNNQMTHLITPPILTEAHTTIISYNGDDKVETVKNPLGHTYTLDYDTASTDKNVTVTFPNRKKNQYWFNEASNPTKVIEDLDGEKITTTSLYEGNELIESTEPNDYGDSPTETYAYDEEGNIDSETSPYGSEDYDYDNKNNLKFYEDTESNETWTTYDGLNAVSDYAVQNAVASYTKYNTYGSEVETTSNLSAATNLLINGSFQSGMDGWAKVATPLNDSGTVSIDSNGKGGLSGNGSLKVSSQSTSSSSGYLYAYQIVQNVSENATYTFSSDIKSDLTDATAVFKIFYYNASGTNIGNSNSKININGKQDWINKQFTFTAPEGATKFQVKLEVDHSSASGKGDVWFDSVQLEKAEFQSSFNPVENGGFENALSSWTGTGGTVDTTERFDGKSALKIVRSSSTAPTNEYKQTVIIGQKTGDKPINFTLTGMSKSTDVKANGSDSSNYALKAVVNYVDGTNSTFNVDILEGTNEWNRVYKEFLADPDKPVNTIDISAVFGGNFTGTAWFDGLRIINGKNKVESVYDSNDNYVSDVIDEENNVVHFDYDNYGNKIKETDANKYIKEFHYNNANQLNKVTFEYGTTIDYYYKAGLQTNKTINSTIDNRSQNYHFDYDENGNLLKTTGPSDETITNKYDENGRVIETTKPSGVSISNTYDNADNISSISYNGVKYYEYSFDRNRNLITVEDSTLNRTTTNNKIDDQNRETKKTIVQNGFPDSVQTWSYPTDSDKLKSTTFTQGATTESTSYSYNSLDQNTVVSNSEKNFTYIYDENGNVRSYNSWNNTNATYQYTNRNLIASERIQLDNGTIILNESYEYDANGNRSKINLPNNQAVVYTYDKLNQLKSEEYPDGTKKEYSYDGFGNRARVQLTKNGSTTEIKAEFNIENQLTKLGNNNIEYDIDGNRKKDGDYSYEWNPVGQLISVTKNGESTPFATYKYDEQGRRVEKTVNGVTTKYFYDGDSINVLYETDSNGVVLRSYVYSADGQRLAMKTQGQTIYYHYNAHGDVIALTDDAKQTVAIYTYDAWGNVISSTSSGIAADNSFGYAGYMYDKEIKMYYLIARYYQPENGVFLSLDPQTGKYDDLNSQNGYNYASNNPIYFYDVIGEKSHSTDGEEAYELGQNVYDLIKAIKKAGGIKKYVKKIYKNSTKVNSKYGSYTIHFKNGKKYHGKGPLKRAYKSAKEKADHKDTKVKKIEWSSAKNNREAFIQEHKRMEADGGHASSGNYNRIASPGAKYIEPKF
ncbi:DNRLRE domain-containing protein [Gottfriedia sp. NPDC056225]|uniref:DNRLRE domain-containing protein n=1 Tax=Gottfriedia sp. NPDC056225 TaxID=3345751 RepID=UPI0035E35798